MSKRNHDTSIVIVHSAVWDMYNIITCVWRYKCTFIPTAFRIPRTAIYVARTAFCILRTMLYILRTWVVIIPFTLSGMIT